MEQYQSPTAQVSYDPHYRKWHNKVLRWFRRSLTVTRRVFTSLLWRILWLSGLAKPIQQTLCRAGLYRKFPDGRCMYCGKIKTPNT